MPVLLEDDAAVEAWLRGRDNTPQVGVVVCVQHQALLTQGVRGRTCVCVCVGSVAWDSVAAATLHQHTAPHLTQRIPNTFTSL